MSQLAKPRVSLCMIVRNEQENLQACVEPVRRLFDEIVVVDTGSHDATKEIAAGLGARVFEFPWCDDFAAARNESIRHATGDWIFWLDADDRVDAINAARLASMLAGLTDQRRGFVMRCVLKPRFASDMAHVVSHVRLFPNAPEMRWKRRVHESLDTGLQATGCELAWTDVDIHHVGYQDPVLRRRKLNRDLRLLSLEYAANPDNVDTLFYLGMTYLATGAPNRALPHLLRCKELTGENDARRRKLFALSAKAHSILGATEAALTATYDGLRAFPDDPELLYHRAMLLTLLPRPDLAGAEACLVRLIKTPQQRYMQLGVPAELAARDARYQLGVLYLDMQQRERAEQNFQELLADFPDFGKAWVGLGQLYLMRRRWHDVNHVVRQLQKCPCGDVLALVLQAAAHIERDELVLARPLLDDAIARAPQLLWARIVISELLLRQGNDRRACIAAQHDILRLDPSSPIARRNLEVLLQGTVEPDPLRLASFTTVAVAGY